MIKQSKAITIAEVAELAGETDKEVALKTFAKQFIKISAEDAKKMQEELVAMDNIKLKEEGIVKIVDFMPEDASELIKVLPGVPLNQDEITKILDIVKKY